MHVMREETDSLQLNGIVGEGFVVVVQTDDNLKNRYIIISNDNSAIIVLAL